MNEVLFICGFFVIVFVVFISNFISQHKRWEKKQKQLDELNSIIDKSLNDLKGKEK